MRLFLYVGAYWLLWNLPTLMLRRLRWRAAQSETLLLRWSSWRLTVQIDILKTRVGCTCHGLTLGSGPISGIPNSCGL